MSDPVLDKMWHNSHMDEQESRYRAAKLWPYMASVLWRLIPVNDATIPTMGVDDKLRWHFNPAKEGTGSWSRGQCVVGVLHECLHVAMRHRVRAERIGVPQDKDHMTLWNYAGDLEINQILADDPQTEPYLIPGHLRPSTFGFPDNLTAEEYYGLLLSKAQQQGQPESGDQQAPGKGKCGSCSGGEHQGHDHGGSESGDGESGGEGEGEGSASSSIGQVLPIEAEALAEAVQVAAGKYAGHVPALLKRALSVALAPAKVDWRVVLRRTVADSVERIPGEEFSSFRRTNRRQSAYDNMPSCPILPLWEEDKVEVTVLVDTSGSMGQAELTGAINETASILAALDSTVTFVTADTQVNSVQTVESAEEAAASLKGGGGTDMSVAIGTCLALDPRPSILIVLTDCYTGWPSDPPSVPVIVVGLGKNPPTPPPFYTFIHVEVD